MNEKVYLKRMIVLLAAVVVCLTSIVGCTTSIGDKTTYRYNQTRIVDGVRITRSVYTEDSLTIYIFATLDNSVSVSCFDKDFNFIDRKFEASYSGGKLVIEGENVSEVSGVKIMTSGVRCDLRYLDSDQYAILLYYDATDAGWVLGGGDEYVYYTDEERAAEAAKRADKRAAIKTVMDKYEGLWLSTDDSELEMRLELYYVGGAPYIFFTKNLDDGWDYYHNITDMYEDYSDVGTEMVINCCDDGWGTNEYFYFAVRDDGDMLVWDWEGKVVIVERQ